MAKRKEEGYKINNIKTFWDKNPPQVWYSGKKEGTKEYFEEVAFKRYNIFYRYLPSVAEFDRYKDKKVLEIGCGVGTDGLQFAKNGAVYTGLDLTETAVKTAKKHFELFGLKGVLVQGNAEELDFEDNSFDMMYSFGVLHHTPHPQKAFDEIHRVLRPGGKMIIMLYARGWKHWFFRVFYYGLVRMEFFRYGIQKTYDRRSDGKSLTYIFTKKQIKSLLKKFQITYMRKHRMGAYFDWGTAFPRWLVRFAYFLRLDKILGENWIIKAHKK